MYYVGVDLHKETSWFCIVDSQSKKYDSKNIQNKPEILKRYFDSKLFICGLFNVYTYFRVWQNGLASVVVPSFSSTKTFCLLLVKELRNA